MYSSTGLSARLLPHWHWRARPHVAGRSHLLRGSAQKDAEDWVSQGADGLRAVPLVAGVLGIGGVVFNRVVSGVAPVVSASSSQSRADVLVIFLSGVLVLTGLQWLTVKPKVPVEVELEGAEVTHLDAALSPKAAAEILWAWQALRSATRARSMVVFCQGKCLAFLGYSAPGQEPSAAKAGPICEKAMQSETGNYLANLVLFPGRLEFSYLPSNAQGALIQPIGSSGVMVLGTNTQRGFSRLDQAWASTISDKLEVELEAGVAGVGFGQQQPKTKRGAGPR